MSSIQYKIEKLLDSKKLTKTAFAKAVGIHIDTVYNLKDETIKVSTLLKISEVLGVPIMYFFEKEIGNVKLQKTDPIKIVKSQPLTNIEEEGEVFGAVNYKQKYYEAIEKLNSANERLVAFMDIKKGVIKKK